MSRPVLQGGGFAVPRPTRVVLALIIANVAIYAFQLVALRIGSGAFIELFYLKPSDVYTKGYVWQLFTYGWFHSPGSPSHLLFNMLWLWIFGNQMEPWWGQQRFLRAYGIFVLSGGLLTVVVSLLCEATGISPNFPYVPHLGASGATTGITIAWGLTHANRQLNLFLLGPMRGITFVWLIVGVEVLTALSFSNTSSTAHFGGIIGAFILCRGLWRPAKWRELFRTLQLRRNKAAIERELKQLETKRNPPPGWQVIEGGKPPSDDPKKWN